MGVHVVVAAGGTAGHVNPALAVADALRRADPGVAITVLGTQTGLEQELVPAAGYQLAVIPRVPLPRRPTPQLAAVPVRLAGAVRAAARIVRDVDADVVVGFGGYVALPAYLAGRRQRIPVIVHEANARPGLANRWGARLASRVAVSFPGTPLPRAEYVGLPLRRSVADLDRRAARASARQAFGLAADAPTLLVTGGSQGARRINQAVVAAAGSLAVAGIQVLHHAGKANAEEVSRELAGRAPGAPAHVVVPYVERMELAYAAADIALCRAGANTCAEMAAVGLPAAYIPLPHGNGEQRLNALPVVEAGGGLIVPDEQLDGDWVTRSLVPLALDGRRLAEMSARAESLGRRDADEVVARMVLDAGVGAAAVVGGHR